MRVDLNPYVQQVSPNGHPFRVSAIRLIKRSWNSYDTHVLIKKDTGFQILILGQKNEVKKVFNHGDSEYERLFGAF